MTPRACSLAFGLLISLLVGDAEAAASRVVLLRGGSETPLVRQAETLLAGELRAAGFEVVQAVRGREQDLRAELEAASARLQPMATLAMMPIGGASAVDLWVLDTVTGKLVIRRIEVAGARDEGTAAASLALRAVELLRGSLLEVTIDRPAAAPAPPADVARFVAAAAPERPAYFLQGLGLSIGASVAGGTSLGPAWSPLMRASWGHRRGLGVRLTLLGPGLARDVGAAEGSGTVSQEIAMVEGVAVFRPRASLQPFVTAGTGAQRVRARGTGVSSLFPDGSDTAFGAVLGAGTGLALRLGRHAALVGDLQALALLPATRILIAGREVGRTSAVSLLATLGLASSF